MAKNGPPTPSKPQAPQQNSSFHLTIPGSNPMVAISHTSPSPSPTNPACSFPAQKIASLFPSAAPAKSSLPTTTTLPISNPSNPKNATPSTASLLLLSVTMAN